MDKLFINLRPEQFTERETVLAEAGPLQATTFRFESGVAGLRLANERGQLVLLPFQGQQIWSADFDGRSLTMKSMFDQPRATDRYLETYGGFLLHCGATAMGVPGPTDSHPLHGELPNAPYQRAYLVLGEDQDGPFIGLGGRYRHIVAFNSNLVAQPEVIMHAGSALLHIDLTVTNLKNTPMELMYLAHINFRPVDNGRLVYTAHPTPDHVRVRTSIPSHVRPGPGYKEFLEQLTRQPDMHNVLRPGLPFDPEVVFFIDYLADERGWAHSMQIHPNGKADYVAHRPDQLDHGIRWISRTPDQDALGLVLPATAEPEGYTAERAKGNIKVLGAKETFHCQMIVGALTPAEAEQMEQKIENVLQSSA